MMSGTRLLVGEPFMYSIVVGHRIVVLLVISNARLREGAQGSLLSDTVPESQLLSKSSSNSTDPLNEILVSLCPGSHPSSTPGQREVSFRLCFIALRDYDRCVFLQAR